MFLLFFSRLDDAFYSPLGLSSPRGSSSLSQGLFSSRPCWFHARPPYSPMTPQSVSFLLSLSCQHYPLPSFVLQRCLFLHMPSRLSASFATFISIPTIIEL
ncbi:hypothetical protein V6N11_051959 [Hibiscus sabdariffa]|uniref:Uncharacterized protein n=1 Tax=Hibiscus sabdariffa TaxID=183260 RepID=A0ABR2U9D3_9ROSI